MAVTGRDGRETFYEAQARHRRSSWRFTALSAGAVLVLGLPLSVLVSPFASALVLVTADVVNLVVPTPDIGDGYGGLDNVPVAGGLLVPGMVVMGLAWLAVRRIFMRSAAGAVVLASGARLPDLTDPEERRLVNLVEEMALAAGIVPPRVMVVDSDAVNAAVVGRSVDDVTIIVHKALLEELGRDPTSAVIADLLATVVNGDLHAALVIASVFQTFDLVGAALAAPFSRKTRRVLRRLVRLAMRPDGPLRDGREEHYIAEEMADLAMLGGEEGPGDRRSGCLTFPFLASSVAYSLTHGLVGLFLVTPIMGALWRRRRLLADATAVELTRNPDALVRAFKHLGRRSTPVPAGPWSHLFVVGPEIEQGLAKRRFDERVHALRAEARRPGESTRDHVRRRLSESTAGQAEYQKALNEAAGDAGGQSLMRSGLDRFIPPMDVRLRRLEAMGAQLLAGPAGAPVLRRPRPTTPWGWVKRVVGDAVGWVLGALLVVTIAVCVLLLIALLAGLIYGALLLQVLVVALPVYIVHAVLR